jgi:hypothetical protein
MRGLKTGSMHPVLYQDLTGHLLSSSSSYLGLPDLALQNTQVFLCYLATLHVGFPYTDANTN